MNPTILASLRRLAHCRRVLNDLDTDKMGNHTCYPELCRPLNERDMICMGVLPPGTPIFAPNVWLCRYNAYHVCSVEECNRAMEGTCPISGATFAEFIHHGADYDEEDARTWNAKPAVQPLGLDNATLPTDARKRRMLGQSGVSLFEDYNEEEEEEEEDYEEVQQTARGKKRSATTRLGKKEAIRRLEHFVHIFLFDAAPRVAAQKSQLAHLEQRRTKMWHTHVAACRQSNRVIDLIGQMIRDSNTFDDMIIVPDAIPSNVQHERYYVDLLFEMYEKACAFLVQPKVDIVALGLAVLFAMRTGMTVAGHQVLPLDEALQHHVPPLDALSFFHFQKRKFTTGSHLLREMYKCAVRLGRPREDFVLRTTLHQETQQLLFMPSAREWKRRQ